MHPIVSEMIALAHRDDIARSLSRRSTMPVPPAPRRRLATARRWTAGHLRTLARRIDVTTRLDQEAHAARQ